MNFLLDTCVISELASGNPNKAVVNWIDELDDGSVFISVITIGEIKRGIERLPDSRRRKKPEEWLDQILVRFERNILSLDVDIILCWGRLTSELDKAGAPIPALDSLIAATAAFHELTLATRNTVDFKRTGIALLDPWL